MEFEFSRSRPSTEVVDTLYASVLGSAWIVGLEGRGEWGLLFLVDFLTG
jgi:hypothetical protein